MKMQSTKFLALLGISAIFGAEGSVWAATEAPDEARNVAALGALTNAALQEPGWVDGMLRIIEKIYVILGGDPTGVDRSGTAAEQFQFFVGFVNSHDLPQGLSQAQRAELIEDVQVLYGASFEDVTSLDLSTRLLLRSSMLQLWGKLIVEHSTF